MERTRVNINLPTDLVEEIRDYSYSLGLNLTSAFVFILRKGLFAEKLRKELKDVMDYYNISNY